MASKGLPVRITSSGDIDTLLSAFQNELKTLNFWQYYVLDVKREKETVLSTLKGDVSPWGGPPIAGKTVVELANLIRSEGLLDESKKFHTRFAVHVNPSVAASLVKGAFTELNDPSALAEAWVKVADVLNVPLYQEWEDDTKVALENIKGRIQYTRLDDHGPRLGEINEE